MLAGGPGETSGEINQAIMDLGQLVCRTTNPACSICPWQRFCRARREGSTEEIPMRTKARPRRELVELAARITRGATILMARRRERGLFGGLWELPSGPLLERRPKKRAHALEPAAPRAVLLETLRRDLGVTARVGRELASVDRVLTHMNLKLIAFAATTSGSPRPTADGRYLEARFVPKAELARLGLSSASRKLLTAVGVW